MAQPAHPILAFKRPEEGIRQVAETIGQARMRAAGRPKPP